MLTATPATPATTVDPYAALTAVYGGTVVARPNGPHRWETYRSDGTLHATAVRAGDTVWLEAHTVRHGHPCTVVASAPATHPVERMAALIASAARAAAEPTAA